MEFYFIISSTDSKRIHTSNTAFDFVVKLPNEVMLNGEWEVALTEFHLDQTIQEINHSIYALLTKEAIDRARAIIEKRGIDEY